LSKPTFYLIRIEWRVMNRALRNEAFYRAGFHLYSVVLSNPTENYIGAFTPNA